MWNLGKPFEQQCAGFTINDPTSRRGRGRERQSAGCGSVQATEAGHDGALHGVSDSSVDLPGEFVGVVQVGE